MSFPVYPAYKSLGIEWLGEVPEHWGRSCIKYIAEINMGQSPSSDDCNVDGFGLPFLQGNSEFGSEYPTPKQYCPVARKFADAGDLLISVRAPVGALNEADQVYGIGRGLCALKPSGRVTKDFLRWFLSSSQSFLDSISTGSTFEAISAEQVANIPIALPRHVSEQAQIARFLDHETACIDALIEEQQRLIELLKEKRQTVISHAVTKGLDPTVLMKDSGVEWLGEVPVHWEVLATKRFFRMVVDPAPENNDFELLSIYTEIGVRPRKDLEQKGNKASTTDGYLRVKKGDLIVNKLLAWMGAIGHSEYDGVTSPAYDILRPGRELAPKFYHYVFRGKSAQQEFKRWSRGIMEMRLRLYFDELGRILMPFPPSGEQEKIVEFIEAMEAKFDSLTQAASEQVKLLSERRSALISAAVTGKIDVRSWQPPASAQAPELENEAV
ncbi:restriction endonuclease subunit S [Pseudomonas putida]|uniref:restriction endonuclease subunit S n=1 Tax=Pseudomonas putida TaxID=303 RepID=UPI002B248FD1|nr:restriction endonuclease subunit S [Pseudomonas putida]